MNLVKLLPLILFLGINVSTGCRMCDNEQNENELKTGKVFFDQPSNKLWRHRVNTIEELKKYSKDFIGLEIDLFFDPQKKEFIIKHDEDSDSQLNLMDYLGSILNPDKHYYWLDIKNLRYEYNKDLIDRLLYLVNLHDIKNNIICESWETGPLEEINDAGISTCFWIPSVKYNGELGEEQKVKLEKIQHHLKKCKHNAISASHTMLPFIKDYLSDCSVHLWTNGLHTEEDKVVINEIANHNFVKVVLIDYDEPF